MTALLAGLWFYSGGLLRAGVSGAVPLSVREAGGARSALLLRLGQALLQFMSRSPAEDVRNTAGKTCPDVLVSAAEILFSGRQSEALRTCLEFRWDSPRHSGAVRRPHAVTHNDYLRRNAQD